LLSWFKYAPPDLKRGINETTYSAGCLFLYWHRPVTNPNRCRLGHLWPGNLWCCFSPPSKVLRRDRPLLSGLVFSLSPQVRLAGFIVPGYVRRRWAGFALPGAGWPCRQRNSNNKHWPTNVNN